MRASARNTRPAESGQPTCVSPSTLLEIERPAHASLPSSLRRIQPQLIIRDNTIDEAARAQTRRDELVRRGGLALVDVGPLPAMPDQQAAIDRPPALTGQTTSITELLADLRAGRREAFDEILPLVYHELRRAARRELAMRPTDSLSTTALVHELYLKFSRAGRTDWHNRAHFLSVASVAMRHMLVDRARRRRAEKRGGPNVHVTLDDALMAAADNRADSLLELHEALDHLAKLDPRLARVVECRFFGGMTEQETAEALHVAVRTVRRDWIKARGLLYQALGPDAARDHTTATVKREL